MATGRQNQKKAQSNATQTPATGMFKPRPFAIPAEPLAANAAELQTKAEQGQVGGSRLSPLPVSEPLPIQPKLAIGAPDDKYEQEADTIARQVVKQISTPTPPDTNGGGDAMQRQMCSTPSIMRLTVQRREAVEGGEASSNLESTIRQARSSGRAIGEPIRRQMEGAFGADFSNVRVHTNNTADTLNRSLSARAFTTGNNIFFKQGEYNPSSSSGKELLAHELTHVVQQSGSSTIQRDLTPDQIKHANRIRQARGLRLLPVEEAQVLNPVEEASAAVPESAPAASAPSPQSDAKREGSKFHMIQDYFWIRDKLKECQSWDKVKQLYASQKESMWKFFDFRQWYVDSLINVLRDKYPTLIAKSVGSQDPTSDYDITISTPNSGEDVEAIEWFNIQVRKEFGVEPGTLFDTNLYAKDYLKVQENIDESAISDQKPDADLEQPDGVLGAMGHLSQDVAALVKQRRYMKQVEWDRYVDEVVQSIDDPARKKLTLLQYEEADSVYQIFAHELLEKVEEENDPDLPKKTGAHPITLGPEEEAALSQIKSPDNKLRSMLRDQLLGSEKLQAITHENPDLVLQKSNQLYLERMRKVRQIQATIRQLGDQEKFSEQVKVLRAQVKQILGEACFFAAEAYHSEGAVKHIVAGIQGSKNPEQKAAIMSSLKPEHFLQSFNEQLGDFLKDLNHYAGAQDGKIFYRSSKYLYRLFLAVAELRQYHFPDPDFALKIESQRGTSDKIAQEINKQLVEIRKGNKAELDTDEKKNQAAEAAMQTILGVKTASELKVKILQMATEFNTLVRTRANELSAPSLETSQTYFGHIIHN
ncbi:DUF4157 domain-containing protein [Laspinema sp. A4]|uniref:eCIS core domain-containing protein n=1 Tax=Laspinema sp. D2d TaxID=2953686 RepID=UPI0021BB1A26|nr:DUF4157 domain-containing protein [Laspinema sp. D2d]MCT7983115.1 DUF4157 domain-containing protein [Laspinema sp. D2d]